jgi:hypothetical protein
MCLEMLLRKLPDGPEVQALVAIARQGVAAKLRFAVDDGQAGEIAQQIAGNQNISPDLALWAVRTWHSALNHR